ncbi:hypothetical protein QS468_04035 [Bacillus subtilis]|nr:hypothetical protein [Pseudomonas sp. A29(2023)]MDL5591858.1 hypothetical protein [Bacillus subtilis]
MDFNTWLTSLRSILQEEGNPLSLRNGRWEVTERKELWKIVGSRIFDSHLEQFKNICLGVLSEVDPQFELDSENRYAASVYGKILKYSPEVRKGLSETLALINSQAQPLVNCSQHKPESVAIEVVNGLLGGADWKLWGSLADLLPTIAEAAPGEFLNCVESALADKDSPFARLFSEGKGGFSSKNYMVGLLWALEALGWLEDYFMRVVVILAELATIDPGTNSGNSPVKSIKTILLPWFPQTNADVDKRIASLRAVRSEFPKIAWDVVKSLLPNQHQTSMGTYKPRWLLNVPEHNEVHVSDADYRGQVVAYAALAVEMAIEDLLRLRELVGNLDNLPRPSFDKLLAHLSSSAITELNESDRLPIWSSLTDFVAKHRRFADADWALDAEVVSAIEGVASRIAPVSPDVLYRRLFNSRDFDLYEENGDWERQRKVLEEKRKHAILKMLSESGLQGVLDFLDKVESSDLVGGILGAVGNGDVDNELMPRFLDKVDLHFQKFIGSFIWSRNFVGGEGWLAGLDRRTWTNEQICRFLTYLPFNISTWKLVDNWLGSESKQYWNSVKVNPYHGDGDDGFFAVDRLLDVSRSSEALDCLSARLTKELPFDSNRAAIALLEAVNGESSSSMDSYSVVELIKTLQADASTDLDQLFKVEWAYLPMLGAHSEVKPKLLQEKLANDPDFFAYIVRLIYRSKNDVTEGVAEPNEHQKAIARNAWQLLNDWKRPPGFIDDKNFSSEKLESWLGRVRQLCQESGHEDVAMLKVGEVLYYCPSDINGLWIVDDVARILNSRDGELIRNGFCTEIFNSRGAHWVDPTGAPEKELAELWRMKGEAVEKAGYPRFAASLRELAGSYDRQAERVIEQHAGRQ